MKRLLVLLVSLSALSGSFFAQRKDLSSFAGKWLRNDIVTQSGSHLPRLTWQITISPTTLTLAEISQDGKLNRQIVYHLNGTETSAPGKSPLGKKGSYKLKYEEAAGMIRLTDTMPGLDDPSGFALVIEQVLQLSPDGKTLNVERKVHPADSKVPVRFKPTQYSFDRIMPEPTPQPKAKK
jgi:hypothetical protein